MGKLSPLDGVGPAELGLDALEQLIQAQPVRELILALGASLEAEATIQYIRGFTPAKVEHISRIAFGIPMGGSLEYADSHTLQTRFCQ